MVTCLPSFTTGEALLPTIDPFGQLLHRQAADYHLVRTPPPSQENQSVLHRDQTISVRLLADMKGRLDTCRGLD